LEEKMRDIKKRQDGIFRRADRERWKERTWGSHTVADAPVTDYALLGKTALFTRSPFVLELSPEAQGKTLSAAMVWQNDKGKIGPWSEIQSIIVP
jgi:hypothetical protein